MKKTAERILILTSFLIGLIMLFLICTPTIKSEPFIRTYDLLQDGIVEPIKNFTDSIQDGSGNINADSITADTIIASQLNITNIELTTISGTTALYLNLDVTDTADIKDLLADTITSLKIITGTLQVDTIVEHTIYYETTVITADSMVVNGNVKVSGSIKADIVEIDTLQINNNIIGKYTIEYDSILNKAATDTAEWSKINNIPTIVYDSSSFALSEAVNDSFDLKLNIADSIVFSGSYNDLTDTPFIPDTAPYLLIADSIVITKLSELQNDSDFASYNDTLFFQVSNTDTIYSDTSITADTQMDIINDTSCFVIYGDSYNITLTDFDFTYKINVSGYWRESSQLVYLDEVNNRIIFKADIKEFAPNTILFTIKRGTK